MRVSVVSFFLRVRLDTTWLRTFLAMHGVPQKVIDGTTILLRDQPLEPDRIGDPYTTIGCFTEEPPKIQCVLGAWRVNPNDEVVYVVRPIDSIVATLLHECCHLIDRYSLRLVARWRRLWEHQHNIYDIIETEREHKAYQQSPWERRADAFASRYAPDFRGELDVRLRRTVRRDRLGKKRCLEYSSGLAVRVNTERYPLIVCLAQIDCLVREAITADQPDQFRQKLVCALWRCDQLEHYITSGKISPDICPGMAEALKQVPDKIRTRIESLLYPPVPDEVVTALQLAEAFAASINSRLIF